MGWASGSVAAIHAQIQNETFYKMKEALLIHENDNSAKVINKLKKACFEWIKSHETPFSPTFQGNKVR